MKFTVDLNTCENHGQCAMAAPDLFLLNDDGELAFRDVAENEYTSAELSADDETGADMAADMCPMQAITILR